MDCIFCKIVSGDIPAEKVFENEQVIAFHDLSPQAPHHILIIPKKHIASLNEFSAEDAAIFGEMGQAVKEIARELNVDEAGYRVVINCNSDGGQTVFHTHMHFMAGRQFTWPAG